MTKAETKMKGSQRFYPCPLCHDTHPSVTTLLDVMGSKALQGWLAKNGTAKLQVLNGVMEETITAVKAEWLSHTPELIITEIRANAEARWKLTEETAFWKSGKETGQEAADIGMLAHAWLESHLQGVVVDLAALPEKAQNAVKAYLNWQKDHHLETRQTEQTFYNCKLNYAGTADWVGELDGELSLGDWKTSSGIFFNYAIQGWAYALADETQNAYRLYRQIFIGRFGKNGASEVKIFKRNEFPSIETAREILTACGTIFAAQKIWEEKFPYQRKDKSNAHGTQAT